MKFDSDKLKSSDNVTKVVEFRRLTDWSVVLSAARATMWKDSVEKEPTSEWKRKILLAGHSPIRALQYWVKIQVPYCVSVHLVRHKFGIEHWVSSQRNDRQSNYDRNTAPQNAPVYHAFMVNAEEIMFISKRRLCCQASAETRQIWMKVVDAVRAVDPELAELCNPFCWWYGGRCPEMKPCGLCKPLDIGEQSSLVSPSYRA